MRDLKRVLSRGVTVLLSRRPIEARVLCPQRNDIVQFWKLWALQAGYVTNDLHSTFIAAVRLSDEAIRLYALVQWRLYRAAQLEGLQCVLETSNAIRFAGAGVKFNPARRMVQGAPIPRPGRPQSPSVPFGLNGGQENNLAQGRRVSIATIISTPDYDSSANPRRPLSRIPWVRKTVPVDYTAPVRSKRGRRDLLNSETPTLPAKRPRIGLHLLPAAPHAELSTFPLASGSRDMDNTLWTDQNRLNYLLQERFVVANCPPIWARVRLLDVVRGCNGLSSSFR